jgi:hypothetical protein
MAWHIGEMGLLWTRGLSARGVRGGPTGPPPQPTPSRAHKCRPGWYTRPDHTAPQNTFRWNAGLQWAGCGSYLLALLLMSVGYITLIYSVAEVASALPFHGASCVCFPCSQMCARMRCARMLHGAS